jgi:hypothetical protein
MLKDSVDVRIAALRVAKDAPGLAAVLLRRRAVCPMCAGPVQFSAEDAVTGQRHYRCTSCHWAAQVSEPRHRGNPEKTLRDLMAATLSQRKAQEALKGPRKPRTRRSPRLAERPVRD